MKKGKLALLLAFGLIVALFSGCFSPIGVMPSNTQDKTAPDGQDNESFAVDIYVNQDTRSVAGASSVAIRGGLYNFIQLIVVNEETSEIAAFDEIRKEKSTEEGATLQIEGLTYGEYYKFLLLYGHWERNVDADVVEGDGVILGYNEAAKPVLLSAGYKRQQIITSGKITVNMWPLVINTVFEAADLSQVEPVIGQAVELLENKTWAVKWTIGKNAAGSGNGLTPLLEAGSETTLPVINRKYFVNETESGTPLGGDLTAANSTLVGSLTAYKGLPHIGMSYPVNFYLEYVPFNLTTADWGVYDGVSKFALSSSSPPVWVIRNGLNDKAQTDHTDFAKVGKPDVVDYKSYNGNGGVVFTVKSPYEPGYYVKFNGSDSNSGSYYAPFKTLEKAVTMANGTGKPVIVIGTLSQTNSGNNSAPANTFVIQNKTVTVKGHPGSSATLSAIAGRRVLATSGTVTLENITLTGGNGQVAGTGIWVDSGTLTLKTGAVVTGNGSSETTRGGGILVNYGATLNLEGGTISYNWTGKDHSWGGGGGLFVYGTANLISGLITGNSSENDGGGVIVGGPETKGTAYHGVVKMYKDMVVSSNYAKDEGGGIGVDYGGKFYMYGGSIISNTSKNTGGGLRLEHGDVYVSSESEVLIAGQGHPSANKASGGYAYAKVLSTRINATITTGFVDSNPW